MSRQSNYEQAAVQYSVSVDDVRRIAEDQSFFDDSGDAHSEWLDSIEYAEFERWFESALEENRRLAAQS